MPQRLAEIVIESGLLGREDVVRAARQAEEENIPLVAKLVRGESVDELALVAAIKRHVRVSIVDPAQVEPDPEAMRQISRDVCRRLRVMPLTFSVFERGAKSLRLAMADPTDAITIAEVEHITGCMVESALMPLSAIEELIETGYRSHVTAVMPRKRGGSHRKPKSRLAPVVQKLSRGQAAEDLTARIGSADTTSPITSPFHRVSDEASLEIRHRALLELLLEKEILGEDEYQERVRLLMKQHTDEP